MGFRGKRTKAEVLGFEHMPVLLLHWLCLCACSGLVMSRTGSLLFMASLLPLAFLTSSVPAYAGSAVGGAAATSGGFSCSSVLDYSMWFPVFTPGRIRGQHMGAANRGSDFWKC